MELWTLLLWQISLKGKHKDQKEEQTIFACICPTLAQLKSTCAEDGTNSAGGKPATHYVSVKFQKAALFEGFTPEYNYMETANGWIVL